MSEAVDYEVLKGVAFKENNEFYISLAEDEAFEKYKKC